MNGGNDQEIVPRSGERPEGTVEKGPPAQMGRGGGVCNSGLLYAITYTELE